MDKELIYMLTVANMWVNGNWITKMEKAHICYQIMINMKEILEMVKGMVKESIIIILAIDMKGSTDKIRDLDKESCIL